MGRPIAHIVSGLSSRRSGFAPGSVRALGQVFLLVLQFSPVSIIQQGLHTHISYTIIFWGKKIRSVGGCSSETKSHTIDKNLTPYFIRRLSMKTSGNLASKHLLGCYIWRNPTENQRGTVCKEVKQRCNDNERQNFFANVSEKRSLIIYRDMKL
jgi:hypothetical protein